MGTFVFSDGQTFALLAWVDFFRSTSTGNGEYNQSLLGVRVITGV